MNGRGNRALWSMVVLFALVVTACRDQPVSATPAPGSGTEPAAGTAGSVAAQATATPLPPQEITLCTGPRPERLYASADPAADVVLSLVRPQIVVFGDDYEADGSELLVDLPNVEDGTLQRNDDGTLMVTLHYRDDLVWSDGEPFSIDDALLGLQMPAPGGLAPRNHVVGVDLADEATLIVTLSADAEYPYVPLQPPLPAHALAAGGDLAAVADAELLNPSLGPYALAEDGGDVLRFERNAAFPGDAGQVAAVSVRFLDSAAAAPLELQSGQCDVVLDGALAVEADPALREALSSLEVTQYVQPGQVHEQIVLNTYTGDSGRPAYFADARVRQAVAQAVNRAELAGSLWGPAVPVMSSWLPESHWANPGADRLTSYTMNPEEAARLLDEAGWRDEDGDGVREYHGAGGVYACNRGEWALAEGTPLTPQLIIPNGDPLRSQIATRVAEDLGRVGVRVAVQTVPVETLYGAEGPLVRRDFDMALLASITRPDPGGVSQWVGAEMFLHPQTFRPVHRWELEERWLNTEQMIERLAYSNIPGRDNAGQGQNYSGWCNEEANRATVEAALLDLDLLERRPLYEQQQAIFAQELPVVPLFSRPRVAASRPDICGIELGPVDPITWNIGAWTVEADGCEP